MDPHSRAPKKNTSHGLEVLPQDTTHLIQKPCYQRGSPCQDPAGNWTTRRPPDHHVYIVCVIIMIVFCNQKKTILNVVSVLFNIFFFNFKLLFECKFVTSDGAFNLLPVCS